MMLTVAAWVREEPDGVTRKRKELEENMHNLATDLSSAKESLAGQGNTFPNCTFRGWEANSEDNQWSAGLMMNFEQELNPTDT